MSELKQGINYTNTLSEREMLINKSLKNKDKPSVPADAKTLTKYKNEAQWRNIRTFRMDYEAAIEACIKSEADGVMAAINLHKPRCDERAVMFEAFDPYFHLKMSFEMLYKQIFLYNNFNIALFAMSRYTASVAKAFSEANIDKFIAKTESEFTPYKNKKGKLVRKEDHVESTLKKLREGYKNRIIKAIKGAGILFAAAKYVKNARALGLEFDLKDFVERVKVIEHFELSIYTIRKQKGIYNLIDMTRSSEIKLHNKGLKPYILYDELGKGTELNKFRHKPQENLKKALRNFERKSDNLKDMRNKIDAAKFKR